jgi:hypothetical protein
MKTQRLARSFLNEKGYVIGDCVNVINSLIDMIHSEVNSLNPAIFLAPVIAKHIE